MWKCAKGQIGGDGGGGSDGHWAERKRCWLGKKTPTAPLARTFFPHCPPGLPLCAAGRSWAGTHFCTWHRLRGLSSRAKAYLSTLTDLGISAPLCLLATWEDSNKSPCLSLLIELQRGKALVHSANFNPSPHYLTMFNVLESPLRHASEAALN